MFCCSFELFSIFCMLLYHYMVDLLLVFLTKFCSVYITHSYVVVDDTAYAMTIQRMLYVCVCVTPPCTEHDICLLTCDN